MAQKIGKYSWPKYIREQEIKRYIRSLVGHKKSVALFFWKNNFKTMPKTFVQHIKCQNIKEKCFLNVWERHICDTRTKEELKVYYNQLIYGGLVEFVLLLCVCVAYVSPSHVQITLLNIKISKPNPRII